MRLPPRLNRAQRTHPLRLPLLWANLIQALVFILPHLLILTVMPEMWGILPIVFGAALFLGWVRIRSESILGPWLVHAAGNVATGLIVAAGTAG
ncbi:MAG TPA: CPBP family intramembrane glutamic endopeptidase [Gemmatimonadota bacterium]|nr:CPBP family intramembrane glutamic endopeptidase [Gemmatimonadota bacterium]